VAIDSVAVELGIRPLVDALLTESPITSGQTE
jgi:hypothetical protein